MNKAKVSTILKCENLLGESCFWDPRYNCLVWTDIEAKKAWMLDDNNQSFVFNLPDRAGFILPRKKEGFIIGFPNFIAISDKNFSSFEKICEVETTNNQTRINDAKVDPYGGIVFGTYNEDPDKAKRKPIDELDLAALGVSPENRVELAAVESPAERQEGIKVESVDELVDKLKNEAKVIE